MLVFVAVVPAMTQTKSKEGSLPALRIKGTALVGPGDKPVLLRGVNLGSWLLLESHFTGLAFKDDRSLWNGLQARFGAEKMHKVREAFRAAWITADDFTRIKKLGLNHVRVPFGYRLLEDDDRPGKYRDDGWAWLDRAVDWSEKAGLYCVLDMHGVPGGQSKADHTGEKDRNAFWSDPKLQKRTVNLWSAIARRYKGRSAIAAFDLMNEPMGAPDGKALVAVQIALAQAIRRVDPNRLVIIEDGYKGLQAFPRLAAPLSRTVIYSQHHYPTMGVSAPSPDVHEAFFRNKVPQFAREQTRFRQPLYVGEWNVIQEASGGGPMARKHIEEMEARGWSWALWIYKQSNKGPVRECWSLYRNNKALGLPDLEKDDAEKIITSFAQLKTENMVLYQPLQKALTGEK
jgi:glucan 1,3-beta-glucosidase